MVVDFPRVKNWKDKFIRMKRLGGIWVSMRWRISSEGPNQMLEPSLVEQESYEKIREQTFSVSLMKDEQQFKEFWPFYIDSEIVDPL